MNIDKERKAECLTAECHLDKSRCLVRYGRDCIKIGGTKIPIQTSTVNESFPLSEPAKTLFKPYFLSPLLEVEGE